MNFFFSIFQETSFQVVLISGRNYSFILMNYGEIAVTRHSVQVKQTCFLDWKQYVTIHYCMYSMNIVQINNVFTHFQAGYDTVDSTHYFVIPGSINGSSISNLRNSSNVGVPGRWVFRVDSGPKSNKGNLPTYTLLSDCSS